MKTLIALLAMASASAFAEPALESCDLAQNLNPGYSVEILGNGNFGEDLTAVVRPTGEIHPRLIGEFTVRSIPLKRFDSRLYQGLGFRLFITDDSITLKVITENEEVEVSGPVSLFMSCVRNDAL